MLNSEENYHIGEGPDIKYCWVKVPRIGCPNGFNKRPTNEWHTPASGTFDSDNLTCDMWEPARDAETAMNAEDSVLAKDQEGAMLILRARFCSLSGAPRVAKYRQRGSYYYTANSDIKIAVYDYPIPPTHDVNDILDVCLKDGGACTPGFDTAQDELDASDAETGSEFFMWTNNLILVRPDNKKYGYWRYDKDKAAAKLKRRLRHEHKVRFKKPGSDLRVYISDVKPWTETFVDIIYKHVDAVTHNKMFNCAWNATLRGRDKRFHIEQLIGCISAMDKLGVYGNEGGFLKSDHCKELLAEFGPKVEWMKARQEGAPEHLLAKCIQGLMDQQKKTKPKRKRKAA